ncbi:hypothetical protein [Vibrio paucivorans]
MDYFRSLSMTLLFTLGVTGCDTHNSNADELSLSETQKSPTESVLKAESQQLTIKGSIKPAHRNVDFVEVPAVVKLKDMAGNIIAETETKATYDTGFIAKYKMDYNSIDLEEDARYYVHVEGKRGNSIIWENNILISAVNNPRKNSVFNISVNTVAN